MGYFTSGQMVKPFQNAVFNAKKTGLLSDVVETQFGYHIIKVNARTSKTFEEAKADIGKQMGKDALESLRKKAQINLDDAYFGSAR